MKRVSFSEKQPEYRYFALGNGLADVFIYSFIEETVEKNQAEGFEDISESVSDISDTIVYVYDVNEFRVSQDLINEDMVKAEPLKYLKYEVPIEEKTEDFMLEVLADHEERICLMELGIEEVVV